MTNNEASVVIKRNKELVEQLNDAKFRNFNLKDKIKNIKVCNKQILTVPNALHHYTLINLLNSGHPIQTIIFQYLSRNQYLKLSSTSLAFKNIMHRHLIIRPYSEILE